MVIDWQMQYITHQKAILMLLSSKKKSGPTRNSTFLELPEIYLVLGLAIYYL